MCCIFSQTYKLRVLKMIYHVGCDLFIKHTWNEINSDASQRNF